jgi:hypothetical protein
MKLWNHFQTVTYIATQGIYFANKIVSRLADSKMFHFLILFRWGITILVTVRITYDGKKSQVWHRGILQY